ncbi:MAG: hypothetical protein H0T46_14730 [Deltaproteobacteria bacterium]|nr:hypothetical protein [Deltaproteobacteria bacterium]
MTPAERVLAIATAILITHASSARAQSAEAEVLFRDGRSLIKQGKLAQGCAKIEASERLESSIGTLLNLGDCRERLGKLASAWAAFRKAEGIAKNANTGDKREDEARRRAVALEPRIPSLTVELTAPIPGLVLRRNGDLIDPAMVSTAMPLDPGSYVISAEAPGYAPWKTDLVIQHKQKRKLVVPALARTAVVQVPAAPPPPPPATRVVVTKQRSIWSPWRKLSVGLAIVGVGAAGTGVYFGMRARDLERDADARCPLLVCNDPVALQQNSDARVSAQRANILYIGGAVAVGSALTLWFVGAPGESTVVAPVVGSDHAGAAIAGRF